MNIDDFDTCLNETMIDLDEDMIMDNLVDDLGVEEELDNSAEEDAMLAENVFQTLKTLLDPSQTIEPRYRGKITLNEDGMEFILTPTQLCEKLLLAEGCNTNDNIKRFMKERCYKVCKTMEDRCKEDDCHITWDGDKNKVMVIYNQTQKPINITTMFQGKEYASDKPSNPQEVCDPEQMASYPCSDLVKMWAHGDILNPNTTINPMDCLKHDEHHDDKELELQTNASNILKENEENELMMDQLEDEVLNSGEDPDELIADLAEPEDYVKALSEEGLIPDITGKAICRQLQAMKVLDRDTLDFIDKYQFLKKEKLEEIAKVALVSESAALNIIKVGLNNYKIKVITVSEDSLPQPSEDDMKDNGAYTKFKTRVGKLLDQKREQNQLEKQKDDIDPNEVKKQGKKVNDVKHEINEKIDDAKQEEKQNKEDLKMSIPGQEAK